MTKGWPVVFAACEERRRREELRDVLREDLFELLNPTAAELAERGLGEADLAQVLNDLAEWYDPRPPAK